MLSIRCQNWMLKVFRWKTCNECPFIDELRGVCGANEDIVPNLEKGQEPPEDCPISNEEDVE